MDNSVHNSIKRRLAGLTWNQSNTNSVLEQMSKKRSSVKLRRFVYVALILLLVTSTVFAITTWKPFVEKVIQLESGGNGFDSWSLEAKRKLVQEMRAYGMDIPELPETDHSEDEDTYEEQLNEALARIWNGENGMVAINILEHVMGPFWTWSFEDRAWVSQQLLNNKLLSPTDEINLIPTNTDMRPTEVTALAENAILTQFADVNKRHLMTYQPYVSYYKLPGDITSNWWRVDYRDGEGTIWYTVTFRTNRKNLVVSRIPPASERERAQQNYEEWVLQQEALKNRMEKEKGLMLFWSLEDKALFEGNLLPEANEVQPEEAVKAAKAAITQKYDISQDELEKLPYGMYFSTIGTGYRAYSISFVCDEGPTYNAIVNASTGEVTEVRGPGDENG